MTSHSNFAIKDNRSQPCQTKPTTYIRIGIALQQFEIAILQTLIDGNAIASDGGKHRKFALFQIVVELTSEQRLSVILFNVTPKT